MRNCILFFSFVQGFLQTDMFSMGMQLSKSYIEFSRVCVCVWGGYDEKHINLICWKRKKTNSILTDKLLFCTPSQFFFAVHAG